MKSIDKLRKSLKDCTTEAGVEPNKFDTYWITAGACDKLIDEIESEIAERYMELLDLAHHAWIIAVCAMQGMPIPASWGNTVEKGLRERGIDVDKLPYVVPDAALGVETRWHELFGTPERTARTMAGKCCDCLECVIIDACEYGEGEGCPLDNYDALLEWLLDGDAE